MHLAKCDIVINSGLCVITGSCRATVNCRKSLFGVYFGFLGNRMGPRRRHQEVLSKQRQDRGNFKTPRFSWIGTFLSKSWQAIGQMVGYCRGLWEGNMFGLVIQYFWNPGVGVFSSRACNLTVCSRENTILESRLKHCEILWNEVSLPL